MCSPHKCIVSNLIVISILSNSLLSGSSHNIASTNSNGTKNIRLALLLPNRTDIPAGLPKIKVAIDLAIAEIENDNILLPGWKFQVTPYDTQCSNIHAPHKAVQAYMVEKTHVFFGPVCDLAAAVVARFLRFWNVPLLTAGAYAHDYGRNKTYYDAEFYLLTRTGLSFDSVSNVVINLLDRYKWKKLLFVYDKKAHFMENFCWYVGSAIVEDIRKRDYYTYDTFDLDKDKINGLKENLKRQVGNKYSELIS